MYSTTHKLCSGFSNVNNGFFCTHISGVDTPEEVPSSLLLSDQVVSDLYNILVHV